MTADDMEGAKQEWNLAHSYTGTFEVAIQETETSPAPNRRTRLGLTPVDIAGRTNRAFGFIRDKAMNGHVELGDGGSSAKHKGFGELWQHVTGDPNQRSWSEWAGSNDRMTTFHPVPGREARSRSGCLR